jgi:hypothetical protein
LDADGAYKQKPNTGARRLKQKKKQGYDSEEEEEDVVYNMKDLVKKPKPMP